VSCIVSCIAKFSWRLPFASRYVDHTIAVKAKVTSKPTAADGSRNIFVVNCTATTDTVTDLIDELSCVLQINCPTRDRRSQCLSALAPYEKFAFGGGGRSLHKEE